jgi:hypothetical protein
MITEIMQNPVVVPGLGGECFELSHASEVAQELNDWSLRDDGAAHLAYRRDVPFIVPRIRRRG